MNLTHANKIGSFEEETNFFPFFLFWKYEYFPHNLTNPFNRHTLVYSFFQGSTCIVFIMFNLQFNSQTVSSFFWPQVNNVKNPSRSTEANTRLRHSRQPHCLHHTFRGHSWFSPQICIFHCNSSQMRQHIHFLLVPSTHNLQIFYCLKIKLRYRIKKMLCNKG